MRPRPPPAGSCLGGAAAQRAYTRGVVGHRCHRRRRNHRRGPEVLRLASLAAGPAPATPLSHSASAVAPSAAPARRKSGGVCLEEARASGLRDGLRQLAQRASVQLLLRFRLSGPVLLTTSPARAARASCWHPSLRVSESLPWDPSLNRHQAPAQPQAETARLPRPRGVPEPG